MKLSLLRSLVIAGLVAFTGASQAVVMSYPVSPTGNFTVQDVTGPGTPQTFNFNVAPTTFPNPAVFYDTNPPTAQDANSIRVLIAAAYGVNANLLTLTSSCDNISGGCAGLTTTSNTFTLAGVQPFDYLAIHFGGGELFLHWSQLITGMTLTALNGFPGGLSNYRAYSSVPVPGALALFVSGLGFLGLRRKMAQRSASTEPALA